MSRTVSALPGVVGVVQELQCHALGVKLKSTLIYKSLMVVVVVGGGRTVYKGVS